MVIRTDRRVESVGQCLTRDWSTSLAAGGSVDFGIEALQPHLKARGAEVETMLAPRRDAPVLLPAYLDQWAQTSPRPYAEADLATGTADDRDRLAERLAMVPPGSLEAISLPVWTVRQLARGHPGAADDDVADVEGVAAQADVAADTGRGALIWRGRGCVECVDGREIQPATMIVVPAGYGGIGVHGTFEPVATEPVLDLGDLVQLRQRRSPTLRLDPRVLGPLTRAASGRAGVRCGAWTWGQIRGGPIQNSGCAGYA